ncbi:MAG: prepilin peptidase [Peptostreptococcaceae bacterium]|nr:prepilin peptidase [Peptostreptococcaceae bacterium]
MLISLVLGIIIGSFLNVVIYRLPSNKSIVSPPSACGSCGHRLGPIDLVPVLSYMFLKGKCRHCGAKISARYPLVELLTGGLFALLFWRYGLTIAFIKYAILACILISAGFIDMDHRIIPDELNLFGLIAGIVFLFFPVGLSLKSSILGLLAGGGFLLFVAVISRGAMGGGDIKLFAVIGLFLGIEKTILAMFLTFLVGGIAGILLIATGIRSRKDYMPFGPFISLGAFITIMWYNQLIIFYFNILD